MNEELNTTNTDVDNQEEVVNNDIDNAQSEEEEQPEQGTPESGTTEEEHSEEPEFTLDKDGNLQWNLGEDEEDSEPQAAQPTGEEQTTETEEEPKEQEEDVYTVKVDGEEIEVTKEELLKGYMRQADYTRKTQALAEDRKKFTQPYQQPTQQTQAPQAQSTGNEGQNLNAIAKQIAARNLGLQSVEDLSELDFDHIAAVQDAREELKAQRNAIAVRQNAIQNLENQLRTEDPAYDSIMANAQAKMGELPHKEFEKLRQAYEVGNPEPLRAFYQQLQKDYYSKAIKKTSIHKKPVPKVVSSNTVTPAKQTKKVDFRQLGKMTTDEKAKFLIESGIV